MQLNPRENFTVVRQIEDHTDNATYYVRAVIRNAKTDAVITTIDLDDKGSRRFTKAWLVPADPSGQGFYVSILTTVYTDSGYTTKSENYGEKIDIYLIQERLNQNLVGGGGGGADVDYKKIKKIVDESVDKGVKSIDIPKAKDVAGPISQMQKEVLGAIKSIEIPKTDISSIPIALRRVESTLSEKIDGIHIPEQIPTDLSPVMEAVFDATKSVLQTIESLTTLTTDQKEEIKQTMQQLLSKNTSRFNKIVQLKKILDDELTEGEDEMVASPKKEAPADDRVKRILRKS